jgi:hypothetical protein
MKSNLAFLSVEQRCIIKFLVKEKVKPAVILRMLNVQYGYDTLSSAGVPPHALVHPIADRRIAERAITCNSGISIGSVETIIHEQFLFKKIRLVRSINVKILPEWATCYCVCRTCAPV